ncbi:MAG: ferrous iron transport protein A [Gammaproteobacteria bacterium]|jgi:Fe2+ transport system protein FeoA|nr:ferrous iron transport protein A [Gammaproteobacteria bacterium]
MDQRVSNPVKLTELPAGTSAMVSQIAGGRELRRKLRGLGIRLGSRIRIEHRRGSGLVVSSGSVRVALGGGIVDKLLVTPVEPDPPEQH